MLETLQTTQVGYSPVIYDHSTYRSWARLKPHCVRPLTTRIDMSCPLPHSVQLRHSNKAKRSHLASFPVRLKMKGAKSTGEFWDVVRGEWILRDFMGKSRNFRLLAWEASFWGFSSKTYRVSGIPELDWNVEGGGSPPLKVPSTLTQAQCLSTKTEIEVKMYSRFYISVRSRYFVGLRCWAGMSAAAWHPVCSSLQLLEWLGSACIAAGWVVRGVCSRRSVQLTATCSVKGQMASGMRLMWAAYRQWGDKRKGWGLYCHLWRNNPGHLQLWVWNRRGGFVPECGWEIDSETCVRHWGVSPKQQTRDNTIWESPRPTKEIKKPRWIQRAKFPSPFYISFTIV